MSLIKNQLEAERRALQARRNRFGAWLWRWREVNGLTQTALATRAGISKNAIWKFERGLNLPNEETAVRLAAATGMNLDELCAMAGLRPHSQWACHRLTEEHLRSAYIDERRAMHEIAAEIGVSRETVTSRLRRFGINVRKVGGPRRYAFVDARPFAEPETDLHAYWLGFLAADGCVFTAKSQNIVRLRLKASDHEHVRMFAASTGTSAPVVIRMGGYAEVTYSDSGLVLALARWGIVPAKTLTIDFPQDLPGGLQPAFVRGYFDGDGSIYWRFRGGSPAVVCKFVSGSRTMLNGLEQRLHEAGIVTGAISSGSGRALVLPVLTARANLQRFAAYLYKDAAVWLPRKRAIFQELGCLA